MRAPEAIYRASLNANRPLLQNMIRQYLQDNRLAAMVFPTTMVAATLIGQEMDVEINGNKTPAIAHNISPGSCAALPGLVLPAWLTRPVASRGRCRCANDRAKFIHALGSLGKHLESAGRLQEAIGCYLKGLDADPIVEPFYQGLVRCYEDWAGARRLSVAYRILRQTLWVVLGIKPSASTEKLYQSLR